MTARKGQRVRFTIDGLGSSPPDELYLCTADIYNIGEGGILAFPHPNQKPAPGCKGWWGVEVDSKTGEPRKLIVWASPGMFEVIP